MMVNSHYLRWPNRRTGSTCPPAHYDFHCFVSYTTREDEVRLVKPLVDAFVERIREADVLVCPIFYDGWYLERREYPVRELSSRLHDGIQRSAFTIAFVSPGYIESEWCRFEWTTTVELHSSRDSPATAYSVLPVLWKRPPNFYFRRERRKMLDRINKRMSWQRQPFLPNLGKAVDITHLNLSDPWVGAPYALWYALLPVPDYLDKWYPDRHWRHIQPFKKLFQ